MKKFRSFILSLRKKSNNSNDLIMIEELTSNSLFYLVYIASLHSRRSSTTEPGGVSQVEMEVLQHDQLVAGLGLKCMWILQYAMSSYIINHVQFLLFFLFVNKVVRLILWFF